MTFQYLIYFLFCSSDRKRRKSEHYKREKQESVPEISTDQIPFDYDREICAVADTKRTPFLEIYPLWAMSASRDSLDGDEMDSVAPSSSGSPRQRSWSLSSGSEHYKREKQESVPEISTDQTPFDYDREICTVADTKRTPSLEIYPPLAVSPVKESITVSIKGSRDSLDGDEMDSEARSSSGSPRQRSWSFSSGSERYKREKQESVPEISTDQTPFDYDREICTVADTKRTPSLEIYPPLAVSPVKESITVSIKGSRDSLDGDEMDSEAPSSSGSPRQRSWSFSPVSEPPASPVRESRSDLFQGSQVSLDLSAIDFSLVSPRRISYSEPSTPSKEWRRTDHTSFDYDREICTVADTKRTPSLEIYPPLAVSPVKESITVSIKGSRDSLDGDEMDSEAPSSSGSPRQRSWSFSPVSEPPASPVRESRSDLFQGSQVSLDLSAIDFSLVSPRRISYSEPSTPSKEWRRSRGSRISLDLSGMNCQSFSAPATPWPRTSIVWTHRPGSHLSLDLSQMDSQLSSRSQDQKKEYESSFPPPLPLAVSSATSSTSSKVTLGLSSVEPPQSPKRGSQSSLPESEETAVSKETLPTSTESSDGRPIRSLSEESFKSFGSSKEEFFIARDDTISASFGSLSSEESKQFQSFQSIPSFEEATLRESASTLSTEGRPTRSSSFYSFTSFGSSKEDFVIARDDTFTDLKRDDASFASCAGSLSSLRSSRSEEFMDTLQELSGHEGTDSSDEFYSGDEKSIHKSARASKPGSVKLETTDQSETVRPEVMIQTEVKPRSSLESDDPTHHPLVTQGSSESENSLNSPLITRDVTETVSFPTAMEQSFSLPTVASTAIKESKTVQYESRDQFKIELLPSAESSETGDRPPSPLRTRDVTETISSPTILEPLSLPIVDGTAITKKETEKHETSDRSEVESLLSTESSENDELPRSRRFAQDVTETAFLPTTLERSPLQTVAGATTDKPETVIHKASDQAEVQLTSSELFADYRVPLPQGSIEDLEKPTKLLQIPQKTKRDFKVHRPDKKRKRYSKFQQESSSDDSDDAMELKQLTPRRRFSLFGHKKRRSSLCDEASRQDSPSHTGINRRTKQLSSTQQESAPVMSDQYLPSNQFSPIAGLHGSEVSGADTLAETSTGVLSVSGHSQRGEPFKEFQPELSLHTTHSNCSSCSSGVSFSSSSSSSEDDRPLRHLKRSAVLPDSNTQVMCSGGQATEGNRSSTGSTHAATASGSPSLLPRVSPQSVEPSVQTATSTSSFSGGRSGDEDTSSDTDE